MAEWKKVIVSGSAAELAKLNVEPTQQISGSASDTFLSGSFSGSFQGDGSGLTGVSASSAVSASYATSASVSDSSISSSYALSASYSDTAISASYAPDTTFPYTGSAEITGSLSVTGSTNLYNSGSTILSVSGSIGELFTITDDNTGDLLTIYSASVPFFTVNANQTFILTGSAYITGSLEVIGGVTGSSFTGSFVGDGSGLYNLPTQSIDNFRIVTGSVTGSVDVGVNSFTVVSESITLMNVRANGGFENGDTVIASGIFSHAEGQGTTASGSYSHAEGYGTNAYGGSSHAEGIYTIASGSYTHAEGTSTIALGDYSHAEGSTTISSGSYSHAEGQSTIALGNVSHAEGNTTLAYGDYSHAEGSNTISSGSFSHAEGSLTISTGDYSHAEGNLTLASGSYSHSEGQGTVASGNISHAEGNSTVALGNNSHSEGNTTFASGDNSHTEGYSTVASGSNSHAEGNSTVASGSNSHSEGINTQALGDASHSEGNSTISLGDNSHAEGFGTTSYGNSSHAEGVATIASGSYSHAEGTSTIAYGDYSHAEGTSTIASGSHSHAEGQSTIALGNVSHAEGTSTIASGTSAHAEGTSTIAYGDYSHAEGTGTIASGSGQLAAGRYNTHNNIDSLVVIGNGVDDLNRSDLALFNSQSITFNQPVTGSTFSGSFIGDGSQLTNITASILINSASNGSGISTFTFDGSSNVIIEVSGAAALSLNTVPKWTGDALANTSISDDGTLVTVTNNTLFQGDITVQGTASFQNAENLLVADRFALFASGSNTVGDGGIVVQQGTQNVGELLGYDSAAVRWGFTGSFDASSTSYAPEAFIAAVIDVDGGQTETSKYQKNGNIRISGSDIWIYS